MRRAQLIGLVGIVVASALWATPAVGQEQTVTGNFLIEACAEALKTQGDPTKDFQKSAFCMGYVRGVVNVSGQSDTPLYRRVCFPARSTTLQWVRVVYNWLEDHPEALHEHQSALAVVALVEAFPCSP